MKALLHTPDQRTQRGLVSVIALLFLMSVVMFILIQSVSRSGAKALESQQYFDSVAALAVAESGTEIAKAQIIGSYLINAELNSSCSLTTPTSNTVGLGRFTFISAETASSTGGTYCKFRVKGTVNNAQRTIETWMNFSDEIGTTSYGKNPKLTLTNYFPVKSTAIFDLAWRVKGSDGYPNTSSTNVYCTDCNTNQLWFDDLTGAGNGLGGVGNAASANVSESTDYSHTLGDDRNYVMVGLLMGGSASTAPSAVGGLKFSNSSNQPNSLTQSTTGSAGTGCSDDNANALVLGISGQGPGLDQNGKPDVRAGFDTADLNGIIKSAMWKKYVHYPNIDGTTLNAAGDVFAEIFYFYKAPVFVSGASGNKNQNTITLASATTNLQVGDYIRTNSDLPEGTSITAINGTTLTLNNKIINKFTGATLCSGICAMVPRSASAATLTLSRNTSTLAKGWVAGLACMKGVNNNYVKVVQTSRPRVLQWHEVISGE